MDYYYRKIMEAHSSMNKTLVSGIKCEITGGRFNTLTYLFEYELGKYGKVRIESAAGYTDSRKGEFVCRINPDPVGNNLKFSFFIGSINDCIEVINNYITSQTQVFS